MNRNGWAHNCGRGVAESELSGGDFIVRMATTDGTNYTGVLTDILIPDTGIE